MIRRTSGVGNAASAVLKVRKSGAPVALTTLLAAVMFAGNTAHAAPSSEYRDNEAASLAAAHAALDAFKKKYPAPVVPVAPEATMDEHLANKVGGQVALKATLDAATKNHAAEKVAAHAAAVKEHLAVKAGGQAALDATMDAARKNHAADIQKERDQQITAAIADVRAIHQTIEGEGGMREQLQKVDTLMKSANIDHVVGAESANGGLALGNNARASAVGSTAYGVGAKATAENSVALGADSVADRENTVSVGNQDVKRTVSNVADGVQAHDAVNVQQLNGNLAQTKQESVAAAKNYTDQQVGEIRGDIRRMDRSFRKGIASVAALQMTTPYAPGRVAVNAGTALYRGQAAVAVGVSYWNTAGDFNVNAGVATAGSNSTVLRAGIGYLF